LVEYVLILAFVAVFVVAALMQLQPRISSSLKATGKGLLGNSWIPCGGGICSFSGPRTVATGSAGSYTYSTATDGATCSSGQTCYFAPLPPASSWQLASNEYYTPPQTPVSNAFDFTFSGTMVVAFGANGHFNYGTFTDQTGCNNNVFGGDPIEGTPKACYLLLPPD
jgi:Flp pilus assembly pilin Flp